MLIWDDLQVDEKIKIYDKGVKTRTKEGQYKLLVDYRAGDMFSPRLDKSEALTVELDYFIECIKNNQKPINDGLSGLKTVKMLTATDQSLKHKGKLIKL